jgi:pilus assembly protein Flp/PilA
MTNGFSRFKKDERGATAIEYALLMLLVGVAGIFAFSLVGGNANAEFSYVATQLQAGDNTSSAPAPQLVNQYCNSASACLNEYNSLPPNQQQSVQDAINSANTICSWGYCPPPNYQNSPEVMQNGINWASTT